jgi:hypothetical protein
MRELPRVLDEQAAARIGWLLAQIPPEDAAQVLRHHATACFRHARTIGWPARDACVIAVGLVEDAVRHWSNAAAALGRPQ